MININKAYNIALEAVKMSYIDADVEKCIDIGDKYVFSISYNGKPIKGAPLFAIEKQSGHIEYISLPDVVYFELLHKGHIVDISSIS